MATGATSKVAEGLSPRGRGKQAFGVDGRLSIGSIPAWAGETAFAVSPHSLARVYPRVGGGNYAVSGIAIRASGLSPRGRGKPAANCLANASTRSIPAWAGETYLSEANALAVEVYPRVGGGNAHVHIPIRLGKGLSPRGRGKRKRHD